MTIAPAPVAVEEVIGRLRARWETARDGAKAACEARGIEIHGEVSIPPSRDELLADFWWYSGMLCALEDLIDEMEIDVE